MELVDCTAADVREGITPECRRPEVTEAEKEVRKRFPFG
jgi:hypothetical protein